MYRVLLAEDEPAALRYLRALIETHFPEFSIVATASDGATALDLAAQLSPELVLTDVKMPRVDGLQFVKQLKSVSPQTPVVIVSGYDDFEYVRQALNTGVLDYVLKPVTASGLSEVLERIHPVLQINRDEETLSAVKDTVRGGRVGGGNGNASRSDFRLAILRYGAPPSRFLLEPGMDMEERCVDGWCEIRGRDGSEMLFVADIERVDEEAFAGRCAAAVDETLAAYHTLLVVPQAVPGKCLASEVNEWLGALDRSIVVGRNQLLDRPAPKAAAIAFDHVLASRIEHVVINSDSAELESLIEWQVSQWETAVVPAVDLTVGARRVLEAIGRVAVRRVEDLDIESVAEEIVARAQSFSDFGTLLIRRAREVGHFGKSGNDTKARDSLFTEIQSYLETTYSRQHTVDSVRSRFRISASYLSRLFRDNAGQSFTEYLRRLRVDGAKRLIRESPEMPMKSVARYAGFRDPFYFSRVFRRVTGETPTEYSRRCRSE